MKRLINKNFYHLCKVYESNKSKGFKDSDIVILEGSSRSGKTIAFVDFIIKYCLQNTGKNILLIRNTYNSHKTTLYVDFNFRLKAFGLHSPFETAKEVSSFKINGNTLHFVGADTPGKFEGAGSNIAYFNELLDINQVVFDQIEQRCKEMIIGDYNPKYSIHWVYDSILKRPYCAYLHSTFNDNPFISDSARRKILSYEPTELNIANGTANDYRWKVYGLGERASQEGLVFRFVDWVDKITDDCESYFWGLDFGNTTGTYALSKGAFNQDGLWLDCPIYGSFATKEDCEVDGNYGLKKFYEVFKELMKDNKTEQIIISDSAQPAKINDLNAWSERDGLNCIFIPVKKFPGCVTWRLDIINRHKLHLVKRDHIKKEQENYSYRTIQGIQTNEPIDDFNHFWDASGYACQYVEALRA